MLKRIVSIIILALCVSAVDVSGQGFMKSLKKKGAQLLKEQTEKVTKGTTKSSGKSSSSSSSSSSRRAAATKRLETSVAMADAAAAKDSKESDAPKYVAPSEGHSVFLETLSKTKKGMSSTPAYTLPPAAKSSQEKWYESSAPVTNLTNKRIVEEYEKLMKWKQTPRDIHYSVIARIDDLYGEMIVRIEALGEYADQMNRLDACLSEDPDWVYQGCYSSIAYALEDEGYARAVNSALTPLYQHAQGSFKKYVDNHGGIAKVDAEKRTVWYPYGAPVEAQTSLAGVTGELQQDGRMLIQGVYYFLNKSKNTARVERTDVEEVAKYPNLVVPEYIVDQNGKKYTVTEMRDGAFSGGTMRTITIPSTIKVVSRMAFQGLQYVTKIELPSSITEIKSSCFTACPALVEVILPNSVVNIGQGCFEGCTKLKTVKLPQRVESFGDNQFAGCTAIETITLPENLEAINEKMFYECKSLRSITLPSSVKSIGYCAFESCTALASVTFNNGLEEIGEMAFKNCTMISKLNFPETLKTIGSDAFKGLKKLTSVVMPNSIETVEMLAFDECTNLTSITIPAAKNTDSFLMGFAWSGIVTRQGGVQTSRVHTR